MDTTEAPTDIADINLADPPATALDVALGDKTTVPEAEAWNAFQALQRNGPELDGSVDKNGISLREFATKQLTSYSDERNAYGRSLFPTETAKANAKRANYHRDLFTKPLSDALDPEAAATIESRAKLAADPDQYRSRQVLKTYLSDFYGSSIPPDAYDRARDLFGSQQLGLKDDTSDKEVFAAIKDRYAQQDAAGKTLAASFDAIAPQILNGDIDYAGGMAKWKEIAPTIPEQYREASQDEFMSNFRSALDLRRKVLPVVRSLRAYAVIQMGRGDDIPEVKASDPTVPSGLFPAAELLNRLPAPDREAALGMLGAEIAKMPEDQRGAISRGLQSAYNTGVNLGGGLYDLWDMLPGGGVRTFEKQDSDMRARKQLIGATQSKSLYKPTDNWLQKGTIGTIGNAPNMALFFGGAEGVAAGVPGMVTMAASMIGDSYSSARVETPKGNPSYQLGAATVSGIAQAYEEVAMTEFGIKALRARLPGIAGLLNKGGIMNPWMRGGIGAAVGVGAAIASEYGEEVVQGATDRFTQDMATRLSGLKPTTDWGQFFHEWNPLSGSRQSQETLAAVVPYALLGAGAVGSFEHFKYGDYLRKNATMLRALGATEEQVKTITTGTDPVKVDEAFKTAFDEAQTRQADAEDIGRRARFRTAVTEEMEAASKALEASGIPIVGAELNDFTGETQHYLELPGQPRQNFDSREDALDGWRAWQNQVRSDDLDILHEAANSELIDFLTGEGARSEGTRVLETDVRMTPDEAVKRGVATTEQMRARLESFALHEGLSPEAAAKEFKKATVAARSFSELARDGTTRYTVELFRGADPVNVIEDMAEDAWKRGVEEGFVTPDQLIGWLRDTEDATGNRYLPAGYEHNPANPLKMYEGLSAVSREYALGQLRNAESLPEKFRAWLEMIVAYAAHTFAHLKSLARSQPLMEAIQSGKLDSKFVDMVRDSVGMNQEATEARLNKRMEAQLAAEAMGGFPEVSEAARGLLPHPDTLRAKHHPLAGEMRRLWEAMKTPTRRRRKDGTAIDDVQKANAYFLPVGEMVDLDDVRNALNEKGFDFDTPADMLDALDSSLSYGRPVHGIGANGDLFGSTFSLRTDGAEEMPAFYSQLQRVVDAKLPNRATPAQVLATIDPARGSGVKAEEIKWSGIEDAVQRIATENGGMVSKAALLDHLRNEGAVKFAEAVSRHDETALGKLQHESELARNAENEARFAVFDILEAKGIGQVQRLNFVEALGRGAKGEEYQRALKAGRDLDPSFDWESLRTLSEAADNAEKAFRIEKHSSPRYDEYVLPGGEHYREVVLTLPEGPAYTSSHFDAEDYVAHMRLDERPDSAGRPGLFIEEIQSDRHQQGREKGYGPAKQDAPVTILRYETTEMQYIAHFSDGTSSAVGKGRMGPDASKAELDDYFKTAVERRQPAKKPDGVPDAPFRKDWPLQMFKRALRDAVVSGKEWIGWTNGDTQNARFDLSKQVQEIQLYREGGGFNIEALEHGRDNPRIVAMEVPVAELGTYIGKELAAKVAAEPTRDHNFKGDGLKIEGQGMKGFYDAILPTEIGKYVKKWGGKVGPGEVNVDETTPIWKVDITPEMAESVAAGQASFAISKKGIQSLEAAIAQRLNAAPEERTQVFETARDRLASVLQRFEDSENGIGAFSRSLSDDPVVLERRRITEAMAEAQALLSALPPNVRGRVTVPTSELLSNTSERGKVAVFKRLLASMDEQLEIELQKEYATAIENLFDLAKPSLSASRQLAGKLTPETQRLMDEALGYAVMTQVETQAEALKLETQIATIEDGEDAEGNPSEFDAGSPEHLELLRKHDLLETFGSIATRSAADMEQALEQLTSIYSRGRMARKVIAESERAALNGMRSEIIGELGRPTQPQHSKRTADAGIIDFVGAYRLGISSFHQVMEALFPKSGTARDFQDRVRAADRAFTRAKIDAKHRMEAFFADVLGAKSKSKRDRIISDLTQRHDDWSIEVREGVRFMQEKMSVDQAAGILDGIIKPGWENDPIAMESLRQALADFRLKKKQDKSRAEFVRFQRLAARGQASFLHLSHLEAAYFLQLAGQAEYLPALDRYGFTKQVLQQLRDKLDPRAEAIQSYLSKEYAEGYDRMNPTFRALYGFDMPRIRNYAPGMFEHARGKTETPGDAFGGASTSVNAMSGGFTKARQHHMARPRQTNALAAYWSHVEQSEYFIAYAETLRDMRAVFRDPQVRRAIEARHGLRMASLFSQWQDVLEVDGRLQATNLVTISEMASNALATQAAIGLAFNVGTWFKQGSAALGTLYSMPPKDFIKGFMGVMSNPGSLKTLWQTETIQQRIQEGLSPDDKRLLNAAKSSPSMILDLMVVGRLPIALVDAALTNISGSVAYQHHKAWALREGMSPAAAEEHALRQFDRAVLQFAQPATTQDKSMSELTATNAIAKAMIMFKSDPRQKVALAAETVAKLFGGQIGKGEAARKLFVGWVLYGLFAQAGGDLWSSIWKHDDDPERWDWKKYLASAVAGPISGVTYVGSALEFAIRKLITGKAYTNNPSPIDSAAEAALQAHLVTVVQNMRKGEDVTFDDVMKAAVADSRAVALILGTLDPRFAAVPVALGVANNAAGMIENTIDFFNKSPGQQKREVIGQLAGESKQASKDRTEANTDEMSAFRRLNPQQQQAKILEMARTDRQKAIRFRKEAAFRQLPKEERDLAKLEPETRTKAIQEFLKLTPDRERDAYVNRLAAAGIITAEIMKNLKLHQ